MGVPKFYRWLSERFPQINQLITAANVLPEFDNFYLDMNGIIHACTHPNDNLAANTLTPRETMLGIFRYIDRMVTEIVKPKKILFMAIDGVAPRAKLNQQRARRFRAAQDREEHIIKAKQRGDEINEDELFDSNCITPGTEFMEMVSKHLKYFIRKKIKEDPLWRDLKVIFSGHDVPGEGEHKIMQFIRDLRADPSYEPNQRHCMYGQDADLIMLSLASHEPHFALLREVVDFSGGRPQRNSNQQPQSNKQIILRQTKEAAFQLLHVSILREYLALDFGAKCPWTVDVERLVDDFIFMTFLVGNDFLPHLPTLDIGENAFDVLFDAYRELLFNKPGYLVGNGEIADYERFEALCMAVGVQENSILKKREEEVRKSMHKARKHNTEMISEEEMEEIEEALQLAYDSAIQDAIQSGNGSSSESGTPVPGSDAAAGEEEEGPWVEVKKNSGDAGAAGKSKKPSNGSAKSRRSRASDEHGGDDAEYDEDGEESGSGKDYRGRYYYEKFKVIVSHSSGETFLRTLMRDYLKGLQWCLAYYIKGCVSWTWYYPYHYGPMLQDMRGLTTHAAEITFELGAPFHPFQQLLGCLPPASAKLLPRCYQWLMVSDDSPLKEFYPIEFGIDQDGKKNPWEAVVLLNFIDETRLLAAEALHCPETKLSRVEKQRNAFGYVWNYHFDPNCVDTIPSCNPEFGLPDIHACNSHATESSFSLLPGISFKAQVIPGTAACLAGFPSLTSLALQGCRNEAVKVNVFGSDSKYKTLILELREGSYGEDAKLEAFAPLLGKKVYANYPHHHESKVLAASCEHGEVRLVTDEETGETAPVQFAYSEEAKIRWRAESKEEEERYLKGRGTPGTGGVAIGKVRFRLRVSPLQGMERDPITGAARKKYATNAEADIPIQMCLWNPKVRDTRFEETDEMPVERLLPVGTEIVALHGRFQGCKGRIVGPHAPAGLHSPDAKSKKSLKEEVKAEQNKKKKRVVDVEFGMSQPETPFGYSCALSIQDDYYSSKDICNILHMSPSLFGKLVGTIKVARADLGLNLKRNGQYQLLGYARRVDPHTSHINDKRKIWNGEDSVEIIGMVDGGNGEHGADGGTGGAGGEGGESTWWEYSIKTVTLVYDYKSKFPELFATLESLPYAPSYEAVQLFPALAAGAGGKQAAEKRVEEVVDWLKAQPFYKMTRTPFSTVSLSRDAMAAIERAADMLTGLNQKKGLIKVVEKNVAVENIYSPLHRSANDVSLPYNVMEPRLGDRVVNLCATGVPFGLKGTVITIHANTKHVEVLFDEEFMGGRGLQGNCSQFRGRLCAWTNLLLVSRQDEYKQFLTSRKKAPVPLVASKLPTHVKGQVPMLPSKVTASATSASNTALLKGHVSELTKGMTAATKTVTEVNKETVTTTHSFSHSGSASNSLKAAMQPAPQPRQNAEHLKEALGKHNASSALMKSLNISKTEDTGLSRAATGGGGTGASSVIGLSNGTGRDLLAKAAGIEGGDGITHLLPSADSLAHHQAEQIVAQPPQPPAHSGGGRIVRPATGAAAAAPVPAVNDKSKSLKNMLFSNKVDHGAAGGAPRKTTSGDSAEKLKKHAVASSGDARKVVLNKDAAQRTVKHQLSSNAASFVPAAATAAGKASSGSPDGKSKSLLRILKRPAEVAAPTETAAAPPSEEMKATAAEQPASEQQTAPASTDAAAEKKDVKALLANAKKKMSSTLKKEKESGDTTATATEEAVVEVEAGVAEMHLEKEKSMSSHNLKHYMTPRAKDLAVAEEGGAGGGSHGKSSGNIASILANAKKASDLPSPPPAVDSHHPHSGLKKTPSRDEHDVQPPAVPVTPSNLPRYMVDTAASHGKSTGNLTHLFANAKRVPSTTDVHVSGDHVTTTESAASAAVETTPSATKTLKKVASDGSGLKRTPSGEGSGVKREDSVSGGAAMVLKKVSSHDEADSTARPHYMTPRAKDLAIAEEPNTAAVGTGSHGKSSGNIASLLANAKKISTPHAAASASAVSEEGESASEINSMLGFKHRESHDGADQQQGIKRTASTEGAEIKHYMTPRAKDVEVASKSSGNITSLLANAKKVPAASSTAADTTPEHAPLKRAPSSDSHELKHYMQPREKDVAAAAEASKAPFSSSSHAASAGNIAQMLTNAKKIAVTKTTAEGGVDANNNAETTAADSSFVTVEDTATSTTSLKKEVSKRSTTSFVPSKVALKVSK